MRTQKYKIRLAKEEKEKLEKMMKIGKTPARAMIRAKILLEQDKISNYSGSKKHKPQQITVAGKCDVSTATVQKVSKQYLEEGLEATLTRKKREKSPRKPIVTGEIEARIIALACSEPPAGHARWTLRLLETKVVELGIVDKISDTTIGRVLKKRTQAALETVLEDTAKGQCRICSVHGRCP